MSMMGSLLPLNPSYAIAIANGSPAKPWTGSGANATAVDAC